MRREVEMLALGFVWWTSAVGLADGDCTIGTVWESIDEAVAYRGGAGLLAASEGRSLVPPKAGVRESGRSGAGTGGGIGSDDAWTLNACPDPTKY